MAVTSRIWPELYDNTAYFANMQLTAGDLKHASSHWVAWGPRNTGYGTQRRLTPADFVGVPVLALTSPHRRWVLRWLPWAVQVSRRMGLAFTQDSIRQLCTVALLRSYLTPRSRVLIIGDGFGTLAGLIRAHVPHAEIHLVDLSFTLREQEARLTSAFGPDGFTFTHADDLERLAERRYDIAVNIASMQEMDAPEIARYFAYMRGRVAYFYCCNREDKTLPDGTRSVFSRYPWSSEDGVLLDERCPWHQWFVGHHPPFVRRYDGPIRHRLARLAP